MINIAFIGTGGVAERHAEALRDIPSAKLAGVWSRTPKNCADFAARHGSKAYKLLDELFADSSTSAVFILSTADTHPDYAIAALKAGKHVLVEKPVGLTTSDIARLRDVAKTSDRVCMPSHNYIYSPAVRRLQHHMAKGKLGRRQSFWMLCNQKQTQEIGKPGMLMNDMMVHLAYSSIFFCGKPQRVVSVSSNVYFESGADDQIGIMLTCADGTIGHLWASWATHDVSREPWMCTMKVFGSEGTGVTSWDNVKNHDLVSPGWDDSVYWDSFYYVQRYFIEECVSGQAAPLSSLEDAMAARAIVDAAIISLEKSSWVEPVYES